MTPEELKPCDVVETIKNVRILKCEWIDGVHGKYQKWKVGHNLLLVVGTDTGYLGVTAYEEGERNPHNFDISHRTFSKKDSKKIYRLLKKKLHDL